MAYDASSAYTINMRWIVPSDTTFSVSVSGGAATIDFSPASKTETEVEATGQIAASSVPILNITNDGNINMNFSNNLNEAKEAWSVVKSSNANVYAAASSFDTTAVTLEDDVSAGSSVTVYLWTDVTNAAAGTTTKEYNISGVAS